MSENGLVKVINPESGQDDTSEAEKDKWGIEQEVRAALSRFDRDTTSVEVSVLPSATAVKGQEGFSMRISPARQGCLLAPSMASLSDACALCLPGEGRVLQDDAEAHRR